MSFYKKSINYYDVTYEPSFYTPKIESGLHSISSAVCNTQFSRVWFLLSIIYALKLIRGSSEMKQSMRELSETEVLEVSGAGALDGLLDIVKNGSEPVNEVGGVVLGVSQISAFLVVNSLNSLGTTVGSVVGSLANGSTI